MPRLFIATLTLGLLAAVAVPAQAQCLHNFIQSMRRDFRRNNDWPYPFVNIDREAVALPFGMQVANGWRRQNLLQDHHFDETMQLNKAGEAKVRWIMTQQQPQRRVVFVQRGLTEEATAARLDAARQVVATTARDGMLAEVVESNLAPEGWPAEEVDKTFTMFNATQPAPRFGLTGGSSSGSSSGGNGNGSNGSGGGGSGSGGGGGH